MNNLPESHSAEFIQQRRKGRRTFILIACLFFGPFVLAALAFKLGWVPEGEATNRGDLLNMETPLLETKLNVIDRDETLELRKKWSLLLFVPDACDTLCEANIDKFEVVHFRLNRDIERVQIVAINDTGIVKSPFARKIQAGKSTNALIESFQALSLNATDVYLIDPLGFAVAQYKLDSNPENLQKDLKRLLKLSRIG